MAEVKGAAARSDNDNLESHDELPPLSPRSQENMMKPASDAQRYVDRAKMTGLGIWVPGPRKGWRRRGNAGIYKDRDGDGDDCLKCSAPLV